MVVGSTIGSGIFRTPAGVAQKIEDVPLFLLAWVIGGIVALCGALSYAELACAIPKAGGAFVYANQALGAELVLTDRQRSIIRWSLEGLSVAEIADRIQVGPERVSDEKYKAVKKLRQALGVDAVPENA